MYLNALLAVNFRNILISTCRKSEITDEISCFSSKLFEFPQIKILSKKVGYTINDIITTSITTGLKKLLEKRGDKSESVQMVIPINIRFKLYPTKYDVKMENKFAPVPMKVPLTNDM